MGYNYSWNVKNGESGAADSQTRLNITNGGKAVLHEVYLGNLYGITQQHALMISMKEIYGWFLFLALGCLLFFLLYKSSLRPFGVIHPKFSTIRKTLKHELRFRMKFRNNKN